MLTDIRLQNFRSYSDSSFEFESGVNIIVGPNATGKTNLLESILMITRGKSYRARDKELIAFNNEWARIDSNLASGSKRTVKLNLRDLPIKTLVIDNKEYKRINNNQRLPLVLFEPNHLLLLSGSPDNRRDYIDDLLEYTNAGYGTLLRQYKRILAQRNAMLKQSVGLNNKKDFFPWDLRLSEVAGKIVNSRLEIIDSINSKISDIYKELSKTDTIVNLVYKSKWTDSYETKLLKDLESNLETDKLRGFTSSGPHKDDLLAYINNHLVQETASRGETRTIILALKITELELFKNDNDVMPALLLDDVFSELDGVRRHALTNHLKNYQTFITTTDADLVVDYFTDNCHVIPLA